MKLSLNSQVWALPLIKFRYVMEYVTKLHRFINAHWLLRLQTNRDTTEIDAKDTCYEARDHYVSLRQRIKNLTHLFLWVCSKNNGLRLRRKQFHIHGPSDRRMLLNGMSLKQSLVLVLIAILYPCKVKGFIYLKMSAITPKYKLYDMPVSNHGARCRLILYKVSDSCD